MRGLGSAARTADLALLLADGTEKGRAAGLHNAFDDAFAAGRRAGFPLAVVDAEIMLEIAERAVGAAMVA